MAKKDNIPEQIPRHGGSFIRHPETGELHPNADDHVMQARIARGEVAKPAAAAPVKNTTGGDQ